MNTNNKQQIVEDAPSMRSVAIGGPPAMPMMRSIGAAPKMPSPMGYGGLALKSSRSELASKAQSTSNKGGRVKAFPAFPSMYPLERTHVRINDASPEEIFQRVSDCLCKDSVASNFDFEEVMVSCESEDHVEFHIRFYSKKDEQVVEMQRSCGCSYSFHQLARSVLRAAKGMPPVPQRKRLPVPACVPRQSDDERDSCVKEGYNVACSLLKQNSLDSQLLAVESLVRIAESSTGAELVMADNEVVHVLVDLVQEGASDDLEGLEKSNEEKKFRAAMTVVANCLEQLKKDGKLQRCLDTHRDLTCDRLVSALLRCISMSKEKPHEACQAVRCLQILSVASVGTRQLAKQLNAEGIVQRAHAEGVQRHANLRDHCQNYQSVVQGAV